MHVSVRLLTYERSGMPVVFIFVSAQYPTRCRKISRSGNLKAEHSELFFFFFCLPPIGSKWYKVLSLWESPNAPPHDPRERKCYLETTSEYTLKARSQSKKNGGFHKQIVIGVVMDDLPFVSYQNVHRKSCPIQIFKSHRPLCCYSDHIFIKGE